VGDAVSYWIGHLFKDSIKSVWPFRNYLPLIARGEEYFHKHGALAIFIGRFSGPLRASVPIVAGMLGMPQKTFQIANFTTALIWVAVLLELGDVGALAWGWLANVVNRLWG
jgi:membrane protein DedA with SNARE-associated domain